MGLELRKLGSAAYYEIKTLLQTITYRMDKQQGPRVQHRGLYSVPWINRNGKEYEKNIYIYIKQLLCCTAEINTTL